MTFHGLTFLMFYLQERKDFLNLLKNAHQNIPAGKSEKSEDGSAMDYEKRRKSPQINSSCFIAY